MKIRLNNRKEASNSSELSTYSNKTVKEKRGRRRAKHYENLLIESVRDCHCRRRHQWCTVSESELDGAPSNDEAPISTLSTTGFLYKWNYV